MLRASMPATPRNVVEAITSGVKPQRWAFEKSMELLLIMRSRPLESDYTGRRADTATERIIAELLAKIRESLRALEFPGLCVARDHLDQAFQHCQSDKMGKAAVEFAKARQAALDASGCIPEADVDSNAMMNPSGDDDGGAGGGGSNGARSLSRRDAKVEPELEGRVEAIRIACVAALYEYEQDVETARHLVSYYMTCLLRAPVIRGQFKVYLNPVNPQSADIDVHVCADRKRLLAAVCLTNLSLQSFFMRLGMADSLESWPTIGLRHMKHFYI